MTTNPKLMNGTLCISEIALVDMVNRAKELGISSLSLDASSFNVEFGPSEAYQEPVDSGSQEMDNDTEYGEEDEDLMLTDPLEYERRRQKGLDL